MDYFKKFQDALETMFPSLTVFSDMDWNEISKEYIASHDERPTDLDEFIFHFPQFLQDKAAAGECPVYLFELAFVELMQNQILVTDLEMPTEKGIYLNPSLSFLNLEFDISVMIDEATKGNIQVLQRPHILCIYRDPVRGLHHVDITTPILEVLQELEDGPLRERGDLPTLQQKTLHELIDLGVVIEIEH